METRIVINSDNLATKHRVDKAQRVATQMQKIINSDNFKNRILNMSQTWRRGEIGEYKDATNDEILSILLKGDEIWDGGKADHVWELYVHDYHKWWSKVVGYIIPKQRPTWVNTKYFDTMSDKKVGSNFTHEMSHHLGFFHGGNLFRSSVSYFLNIAYEKSWDEIFSERGENPEESNGYWQCRRVWWSLWLKRRCKWIVK